MPNKLVSFLGPAGDVAVEVPPGVTPAMIEAGLNGILYGALLDAAWTPMRPAAADPAAAERVRALWGEDSDRKEVWANSLFTVLVYRDRTGPEGWPPITWLSVRRNDRGAHHDWRLLQRLKNEVLGPEWEAVELYPAESRLVDSANQYHLWCVPPGSPFPFGFDERLVGSKSGHGAVQRPFRPGEEPPDLAACEAKAEAARRVMVDRARADRGAATAVADFLPKATGPDGLAFVPQKDLVAVLKAAALAYHRLAERGGEDAAACREVANLLAPALGKVLRPGADPDKFLAAVLGGVENVRSV